MTSLLADLTEKQWQHQVVELARTLGWIVYHTHDSRRSQPGFPDLVLVRERVVYLELKRQAGKLSAPQRSWLRALLKAGAEAYVVRPSDLDRLGPVLATRGRPWEARGEVVGLATRLLADTQREAAA